MSRLKRPKINLIKTRKKQVNNRERGLVPASSKRATLAQLSEVPDFEYLYQYQLPPDCLRVYELYNTTADYVIEGDKLLTNDEEVNLKYIADIEDTNLFNPNFIDSLSLKMAAELAIALANDAKLQQLMLQRADLAIKTAYRLDAIVGAPPENDNPSLWQKAGR